LNVKHATSTSIAISPENTTLLAGQSQTYTCIAYDSYFNGWDITSQTNWNVSSDAGGSLIGNVYDSDKAGTWNVTASNGIFSTYASLTVKHGFAVNLILYPKNLTLTAGSALAFYSSATDAYGNNWDSTNSSVFSIDSGAGGSWFNENVYDCARAGIWAITSRLDFASDVATLTVTHGPIVGINVVPGEANLTAGCSQNYLALGYDNYQNTWDLTNSSTFAINSEAGGSWSGGRYTSQNMGNWTVTVKDGDVQGICNLSVYCPIDFNYDWNVNFKDLQYFVAGYIAFNQNDLYIPAYDLNHEGRINFMDLAIFVYDYGAYSQKYA